MDSLPLLESKIELPREQGLPRPRLDRQLDAVWERGLAIVSGSAGWGKTTLLAQFRQRSNAPVAYYRADATDSSVKDLLRYLRFSVGRAIATPIGAGSGIDEFVGEVASAAPDRLAIVIDDAHDLTSSPAADAIAQLVECAPPGMAIILAGRTAPGFDLSRRRVAGRLVEIGPDDLRFRTWEVESLFRDVYLNRLPPEEIAMLSARLEGWAAGLRLFQLATAGQTPSARRAALAAFGTRRDMCREYLTQNVLNALPIAEHDLLVRTSVLGVLSGELCDEFLGVTGSEETLARLEQRKLITVAHDVQWTYRCHEVVRAHLESLLSDHLGAEAMRSEYRAAAQLLSRHGWPAEAVRAHCRSGDLEAAAELLGFRGQDAASASSRWWDSIPVALMEHDPWILLARARRDVSSGDLNDAVACYRMARVESGDGSPGVIAASEQRSAEDWCSRPLSTAPGWTGIVRRGVQRSPLGEVTAVGVDDPTGLLAHGLSLLLGGRFAAAGASFDRVIHLAHASDTANLGARLAKGVVGLFVGDVDGTTMDLLARECDVVNQLHLARVASAVAAAAHGYTPTFQVPQWPEGVSDRWVAAACLCVLGMRRPPDRGTLTELARQQALAAEWLVDVDARSMASWLLALRSAALVELRDPMAEPEAAVADALARVTGVPGARAVALGAALSCRTKAAPDLARSVEQLCRECGIDPERTVPRLLPAREAPFGEPGTHENPVGTEPRPVTVRVRCFGPLELSLDGVRAELESIRPKARSVLRILVLGGGRPVHRDSLIESLWPDHGLDAGAHNLQVAVSSLRRLFEPGATRGHRSVIERCGDCYRFAPIDRSDVDLWLMQDSLANGRALLRGGADSEAARSLDYALSLVDADLFEDESRSDWLETSRSQLAQELADASEVLADIHIRLASFGAAADACKRGLGFDRYRDRLWRQLIGALGQDGQAAAARRAQDRYEEMLRDLGLPVPSTLFRPELDLSDGGVLSGPRGVGGEHLNFDRRR